MVSQNNFNFPYFSPPPLPFHPSQPPPLPPHLPPVQPPPPPPHHPVQPPPPPHHPIKPPPPPHLPPIQPPPPPPHHHTTVIVIAFVSLGGGFFLAFMAAALFCFLKKKKKRAVQEDKIVHFDEHKRIKEAVVEGPHGTQTVVLSVEDDINIDEEMKKNEIVEEEAGLRNNASTSVPNNLPVSQHHRLEEHKA